MSYRLTRFLITTLGHGVHIRFVSEKQKFSFLLNANETKALLPISYYREGIAYVLIKSWFVY